MQFINFLYRIKAPCKVKLFYIRYVYNIFYNPYKFGLKDFILWKILQSRIYIWIMIRVEQKRDNHKSIKKFEYFDKLADQYRKYFATHEWK